MSRQPYLSPQPRDNRNPTRLLLTLAVLTIAGVGLYLLGSNYGHTGSPVPAQQAVASPSPLASPVALAGTPSGTPPRGQGVGGPQPPSDTPAPMQVPTQAIEALPTVTSQPALPTSTPLSPALRTLLTLTGMQVPARDPYALTARFRHRAIASDSHTTARPAGDYKAGRSDTFNISDIQNRNYYTVTATIRKVTDHAYWYVQNGQPYDASAVTQLANAFEDKIYTNDHAVFGSEWTPGVDNDPRITVLFAPLRGAGGSFSAADEYTREVNPFSNEREMIYVSTALGWNGLEGTLAHEFQHMIHWHEHANQDIWLNEGASVLAMALNGYDVLGVDSDFMRTPNTQLNAWQPSPSMARPNYGAAFLFLDYLREHYGGDKIIRAITVAPETDTRAIDSALASLGYKERFADVFKNWTLANLLDGQAGATSAESYAKREVQASPQVVMDNYPTGHSGHVPQYGANYIEMIAPASGSGTLHVDFSGQKETPLIPAPALSGSNIWWSNRGDLMDTRMSHSFDLRNVGHATLNYNVWYGIEQDFDYAYAEVSTDGGANWDTLEGKYTSGSNPNGTNYGNAYTGNSKDQAGADANGWLHEAVDLSRYAGKEIMVRFEYITDDGYNAQGLGVDDISIPEIGYMDNAEGDTGWQYEGFARVDNKLPQNYYLAVVRMSSSGLDVHPVEVDSSGNASFNIEGLGPGGPYSKAELVIAGMTPFNIQQPAYELSVRPNK